jgi:outer membrane protein OmpA-like peptidoglycan-associated protein
VSRKFSGAVTGVLCTFLYACATPERIVLLPQADGTPSAVVVRSNSSELVLDQPYTVASVTGRKIRAESSSQAEVEARYKQVIEALPAHPRTYLLNFEFGKTRLTAESGNLLNEILQEMEKLPAPELIIIGHTDDVGGDAINDKLSLERANQVLSLIKAKGISPGNVSVVGRGSREPLVQSKSGRAEPKNRRAEIRIK